MIIKRRIQEYKSEEIDAEIKVREEMIVKLQKDLDRIEKFRKQYESKAAYEIDKSLILDEMSDYKLEIEMLKARKNTL